jgi:hypothetical protein
MSLLNVDFESQETLLNSFDRIADKFGKDINIKINKHYYRIIDFEFYIFSNSFPDPHTYKNDLQLQNGKFYLHASGIDITFGDGINHGGILLRSIVKLLSGSGPDEGFMKLQIDGPQNVATELFSNINSLESHEKNEISLIDIEGHNMDSTFYPALRTIKTKRVGLSHKLSDQDDYYKNIQLRYINILPKFPNFKQTIKGIENILKEDLAKGSITIEEANKILGYNMKFE